VSAEGLHSVAPVWGSGTHVASAPCWPLQCFAKDVDQDMVVLLAARASRTENMDAIDSCIVGCLADPKEVRVLPLAASHLLSPFRPHTLPPHA